MHAGRVSRLGRAAGASPSSNESHGHRGEVRHRGAEGIVGTLGTFAAARGARMATVGRDNSSMLRPFVRPRAFADETRDQRVVMHDRITRRISEPAVMRARRSAAVTSNQRLEVLPYRVEFSTRHAIFSKDSYLT